MGYLIFLFYKKDKLDNQVKQVSSNTKIKIKLTRFNPFGEVGGNQSFIISLLDENNSGCIITSLHNKDSTRIYAKEISNSKALGKNILSAEEKECLQKAINNP